MSQEPLKPSSAASGLFHLPRKTSSPAKSCSLPCRHHLPSAGRHPALLTLPHVQRELLKAAPVHQGLTCSQEKPAPHSCSPALSPSCTLSPASSRGLTAQQGNHCEFLQNARANGPTWAPPRSPSCKGKQPHKESPHGNQTPPEQSTPLSPQCHSPEYPICVPPGTPVPLCR